MTPQEYEALQRRWGEINAELDALAELRTSTHNPAEREGELLEALDEIEYIVGDAYLKSEIDGN